MGSSSQKDLVANGQKSLLRGISDVKLTGDYHDLIITCEGYEWKVHRVVVCTRSKFFKKACWPGFKEGESLSIDLKDISPLMVDKLVHYLYNSNYDDTCLQIGGKQDDDDDDDENGRGEEDRGRGEGLIREISVEDVPAEDVPAEVFPVEEAPVVEVGEEAAEAKSPNEGSQRLSLNASMYIVGDRYHLCELKDLAREKLSIALVDCWDKEDLPDVIRTIYENTLPTDRALRDCLVPTLREHQQALRNDDDFMEVVKTHGDFAVDLIDAWRTSSKQQTLKLSSNRGYGFGSSDGSSIGYDGIVPCPDCGLGLNYSFE